MTVRTLNAKARLLRQPPVIDPEDPAFIENPYPYYRRLRETAPVYHHPLGFWAVTRYEEAFQVWTDPRFAHPPYAESDDPFEQMRSRLFIARNPPDHTRLRKIFMDIFTRSYFESLRPRIEEWTQQLLDRATSKPVFDLVSELAKPLPAMVILEIIGLPLSDLEMLTEGSTTVLRAMGAVFTPEIRVRGREAAANFDRYFRQKLAESRAQPRDNLVGKLLAAQARDDRLTDDEIVANLMLMLSAGHETTVSLISSGLLALLRNPAQLEKLRTNLSLMPGALDELLRYEPPGQFIGRIALDHVTLGGQQIRKGETVYVVIGAINRDPAQFRNPEVLDIERARNPHMSFGHGLHVCIGQYLARMEATSIFEALLQGYPTLRLAGTPRWTPLIGTRGLSHLPLRVS